MEILTLLFWDIPQEQVQTWMSYAKQLGVTQFHTIEKREEYQNWDECVVIDKRCTRFYDLKLFVHNCRYEKCCGSMVELADANEGELFSLNSNFTYKELESHHRDGYREVGIEYFCKNKQNKKYYPQSSSERPEHFLKQRPALLLDRDGVINRDKSYVCHWEDVEFNPGIEELICAAGKRGWWVCVLTNQSGIERGFYTQEEVYKLHQSMNDFLSGRGARVDAWFFCPWRESSHLRKPSPGMALQAEKSLPIDRIQSLMVGDKLSDQINLQGLASVLIQGNYDLTEAKVEVFSDLAKMSEKYFSPNLKFST